MNLQGLSSSRKLLPGEIDLRATNGTRIAALAVGSYSIQLSGDSSIILDPCYFVPSCNKNIVSVSSLGTEGYTFKFGNNLCSIY